MGTANTEPFMGLLQAYAMTISVLIATHPSPDLLRPALAKVANDMPPDLENSPQAYGMFQAAMETFQRALP